MAITNLGPMPPELESDSDGHRTYTVKYKMVSDDYLDGPSVVIQAFDELYPVGSNWTLGNDLDIWAFRLFTTKVTHRGSTDGEKTKHWTVEATYSTKSPRRCNDANPDNPMLEPPKVSGTYKTEQEEFTKDRFGETLVNSAHEALKGPKVEFDRSYLTVRIEQNVPSSYFGYELPYQMIDHVNKFPLWGLTSRKIKLSAAPWERKFYGDCIPYYTRTLEFAINPNGFDREILDEGTKVLHGHWGGVFRRIGTLTAGSALVTGLSDTSDLLDASVTGTGIPVLPAVAGTPQSVKVRVLNTSTSLTLTNNATASGTVTLTFNSPNWVLDDIGGEPPWSGNPRHFDRYIDRQGNPSTVVLNGFGVPAGVVQNTRSFNQYLVAPTNLGLGVIFTGIPVADEQVWVRVVADPPDTDFTLTIPEWSETVTYARGQVVMYLSSPYVSVSNDNLDESPLDGLPYWSFLPNFLTNRGTYSVATTYVIGDYVTVPADVELTEAGYITVQAYPEADFLQLGIPVTF